MKYTSLKIFIDSELGLEVLPGDILDVSEKHGKELMANGLVTDEVEEVEEAEESEEESWHKGLLKADLQEQYKELFGNAPDDKLTKAELITAIESK